MAQEWRIQTRFRGRWNHMSVTDEPVVTPDGVNVKAVRRELRLSQSQLARMIGCSIRAVQSVEQG